MNKFLGAKERPLTRREKEKKRKDMQKINKYTIYDNTIYNSKEALKKARWNRNRGIIFKLPDMAFIPKEVIKAHFEQFGVVMEVEVSKRGVTRWDSASKVSRYAFIIFERKEVAIFLLGEGTTVIGEHRIEILNPALPMNPKKNLQKKQNLQKNPKNPKKATSNGCVEPTRGWQHVDLSLY